MCGIAGFNFEDKELLKKMCNSIEHRGPDDYGYYTDKFVSLGNRRLSIIDLNTGKQPIHNEDKTIWVVFNGEIYNFLDIRDELEKRGHTFYTNTDTEVIIHAYEEYKEDCVKLFRGMFAFCLYDLNEKKLFLARDRTGKKPIYYTTNSERFLFASELKALLCDEELKKEINLESLHHYLTFGYVPTPLTILNGIKKLEPGHYLVLKNNEVTVEKYWDLSFNEIKSNEDYFASRVHEILKDSIKSRLISDVPLGALLSGGIDSSIVVGLMSKLTNNVKTFSIGFNEKDFDELKYARIVSEKFNTEHKEFNVNVDLLKDLPIIAKQLDEPFVDPSALPTYYLCKLARKYVKVVLSGDGGDELFAGYTRYNTWDQDRIIRFYKIMPSFLRTKFSKASGLLYEKTENNFFRKFKKVNDLSNLNKEERWMSKLNLFNEDEKRELYNETPNVPSSFTVLNYHFSRCNSNFLNKKLYADMKTFLLDDGLVKVDRMSMMNSLEVRNPFLDTYVVDLASSIPSYLKIKNNENKYILKKAFKNLLPNEILEREKQGFDVPIKHWIKNELRDLVNTNLINDIKQRNYFKSDYVKKIIDEHNSDRRDNSRRIWALLMFELWNKIYIDNIDIRKIQL